MVLFKEESHNKVAIRNTFGKRDQLRITAVVSDICVTGGFTEIRRSCGVEGPEFTAYEAGNAS